MCMNSSSPSCTNTTLVEGPVHSTVPNSFCDVKTTMDSSGRVWFTSPNVTDSLDVAHSIFMCHDNECVSEPIDFNGGSDGCMEGIAVDDSGPVPIVYVADYDYTEHISTSLIHIRKYMWGSASAVDHFQFENDFNDIDGMAIDPEGNVFIFIAGRFGRLFKCSPSGCDRFTNFDFDSDGRGLAADSRGNLYVSRQFGTVGKHGVIKCTSKGKCEALQWEGLLDAYAYPNRVETVSIGPDDDVYLHATVDKEEIHRLYRCSPHNACSLVGEFVMPDETRIGGRLPQFALGKHGDFYVVQDRSIPPASTTTAQPSGWYKSITPASNPKLCLDVPGDNVYNGAPLWLWECDGGEAQIWVFDNWQIRFGADETKCIDAGDMSNGLQLYLWDCINDVGVPQQTFGYDFDAQRVFMPGVNTCLDYYADWASNGQPLHIWECTGDWNQEWSLWDLDPQTLNPVISV